MKKIILILMFIAAANVFANAQNKVEIINLEGRDYTVSKILPKEIIGTYNYEEKGEPIVKIGTEGRYRYTLLIQYGAGGGNYKADSYNLMDVTILKNEGIAMIYGERIMKLKQ